MEKKILYFTLFMSSIFIIIGIFTNILIGLILLFGAVMLLSFIKYPQASVERLILLAVFLAPCSNIFVYKTGYIDLKILQFLWATIFVFIIIQKAVEKERNFRRKADINNRVLFALYITGLALSCLFSIDMSISIKELFQYIYLFLMMYVIYINTQNKDFFNKIISAIIVSNIFLVTICLISYFTGRMLIPSFYMFSNGAVAVLDKLYKTQALVDSSNIINRIDGVMGLDTIAIANCMLIYSLIVNYMIRQVSGKKKLMFIALFLANTTTIVVTYSRAALFIFLITNFITLLGKDHKKNLVLIILALCSIPFVLSMFPTLYERIMEAFNLQEGSTKYHFVYWIVALREGYDYIFTGIGLGNAAYQQDMYTSLFSSLFSSFDLYDSNGANIHNFILQIWAEQGFIGIVTNVILIFSPIVHFLRVKFISKTISGKSIYDFIILAYISTLLFNLTNNNFYIETFWVLIALVYTCKLNYTADMVEKPIKYIYKESTI